MMGLTHRGAKTGKFLEVHRRAGNLTESARVVGIDRAAHYKPMKRDPEYAQAFADARCEAIMVLEDQAVRRAGARCPIAPAASSSKPPKTRTNRG